MVNRIVIIAFFVFLSSYGFSQKSLSANVYRSIGLATNTSFEIFDANYGAQLEYQFSAKKIDWEVGIDMRVIDWGNQVGLFVGNEWNLIEKERANLSFDYRIHANIPLFYNSFLIGYGLSSNLSYDINVYKSFDIKLGLGLRFDSVPAYSEYGPVFSSFELPFTIGLKKRIGAEK